MPIYRSFFRVGFTHLDSLRKNLVQEHGRIDSALAIPKCDDYATIQPLRIDDARGRGFHEEVSRNNCGLVGTLDNQFSSISFPAKSRDLPAHPVKLGHYRHMGVWRIP